MADKLSLQKIILNLLANAIKYTPSGGQVNFIVRDEKTNPGTPDTIIIVRDNGIGMSEEFLNHLYEPFAQEEHTGYEAKGTGLGLSIVRQLVELMGGTIEVHSKQNLGTAFIVSLHFEEADPETEPPPRQEGSAEGTDLRNKKVLLCEDNQLSSEIACTFLPSAGMTVVAAANGRIGVQILADSAPGEFSAVLMGIRMPIMDGYEATRQIRALPRADIETIPIIAMTADALNEDIQLGMTAGMNDYLTKPINPEKLLRLLQACIYSHDRQ